MTSNDPFDDVLHLEEKFYSDGHKQGLADGERAGRTEGRSFGIEKGFEKFVEAGRMYGKAVVWANRLPRSQTHELVLDDSAPATEVAAAFPTPTAGLEMPRQKRLPVLGGGGAARLEKNVVMLHALVEPETLSTENADEAVNDFDDRVKRAQGKTRVIERQTGEDAGSAAAKRDGGPPPSLTAAAAAAEEELRSGDGGGDRRPSPSSAAALLPPGGDGGF